MDLSCRNEVEWPVKCKSSYLPVVNKVSRCSFRPWIQIRRFYALYGLQLSPYSAGLTKSSNFKMPNTYPISRFLSIYHKAIHVYHEMNICYQHIIIFLRKISILARLTLDPMWFYFKFSQPSVTGGGLQIVQHRYCLNYLVLLLIWTHACQQMVFNQISGGINSNTMVLILSISIGICI